VTTSEATPPEERRKDINTRKVIEVVTDKVIEHLDAKLAERDEKQKETLKHYVNWAAYAGGLVAFLGFVFLLVAAIVTPTKEKAAAVEQRQDKLETAMRDDVKALVTSVQKLEISAAEQRATYRVIVEGVSRSAAKAEVSKVQIQDR
jgi:type II secretory pathway component PulM